MQFIDRSKISVRAGDGGKGGDVVLEVDANINIDINGKDRQQIC